MYIQSTPYLEHVTAGSVIDRFRRLASKLEGAAKLVNVFLLMNRRGMAASPPVIKHNPVTHGTMQDKQCAIMPSCNNV